MSDQTPDAPLTGEVKLEGSVYLYDQPELLSWQTHGQLGISQTADRFGFARSARLVPLVFSEIPSAQKHFPVVFTELDNPAPCAVVGVLEDRNLFVGADGDWRQGVYVPGYLRRYPFALARRSEDQFSVVIDRAAAMISDTPELPFFEGEKATETTDQMVEFCRQYDAANRETKNFCQKLKALDLLTPQQVTRQPEGTDEPEVMAQYTSVDTDKLQALPDSELSALHQNGYLASIYAHVFSLENWNRLLEMHAAEEDQK